MPVQIKSRLQNYFSITKREWNGMVVLVILITIALLAPKVYEWVHKDKILDVKQFSEAIAKIQGGTAATDNKQSGEPSSGNAAAFSFNPNHLPASQWRKLGLSEQQITIIQHFEAKGGKFYHKEDLKKIYSISADDYARLQRHISLPDDTASHPTKPFIIVELNTADSAGLTQVRGIGPAFAMRILHYRNRLGGFYKKEQLKEVFGIDDGKYEELKAEFTANPRYIKKININALDFDGLKNNPYLNFKQVNAIIMYRKEHGSYETLAEMKNVAILNDRILRKLAPYLIFK